MPRPPQPSLACCALPETRYAFWRHTCTCGKEDAESAASLTGDLRRHGYDAESVGTGSDALSAYDRADLVLLDPDLSDLDGLEVCRLIRNACDVPIIMISARDTELDRILGLQAGSDDYLTEPYGFRELMARIEAVMRRVRPFPRAVENISQGPLHMDFRTREVRMDGRLINLTRKEFDLLYLLASRAGSVVSRKQIMSDVWRDDWTNSSRTIDTHINSLRKKLGADKWITTVRGVGFRFGRGLGQN